ncbi:MAG: cell surface protein SprA, partial [Riemerella sp.]|nr:cell surface protein SprA [Riemerella sp.]
GDANKKIYVKGRPSIGNINTIVLGVRNQDASSVSKDVLLWVNEIRASGIKNQGGYAANANLTFNLGDFAMVNASGSVSTVGFGTIVQKPSERSQADNSTLHISTTVNLDKFLPEKIGMKIPFNYSYTQSIEDPRYNPLDNDVELKNSPIRDQLKKIVRTYSQQRSIGVVNMQKQRMNSDKKSKFYDVENLSLTAVYNDDFYRDVYTTRNYRQYFKGYLDYNFNFKPWVIRPFNKLISDTSKAAKYLNWIKEVNFNPIPTRLSFRAELDRTYSELQYRNIDALLTGIPADDFQMIKGRTFYFGWQYNLGFNFTKSLKLDINSYTRTLNDHISVNGMNNRSIFRDLFRAGRPVLYNHKVQLNYKLPFEHFPYLDFINAEVGYGFQYNWSARSTVLSQQDLGNLAQNNNNTMATASVNIPNLFSKFKYFQKLENTMQQRRAEIEAMENSNAQAATRKNKENKITTLKNRLTPLQAVLYGLTSSLKQVDFSYNETSGISLPGILSSPNFYGYGQGVGGPTYGFLLGSQADIRRVMIERGWVTSSDLMTESYVQMQTKAITGSIQIQPMNDLKIDLNFLKNYSSSLTHNGYNIMTNNRLSFANEIIAFSHTDILM